MRALARRDRFDRFVSVLVFVPRDRYTSDLRERIGVALAEIYDGRVSAFFPDFSLTHLTRVQFIIGRNPGEGPDPSQDEIEARIRDIVRTFEDDLAGGAERRPIRPSASREVLRDYAGAFGSDYRAASPPTTRSRDIEIAERLAPDDIEVRFFRRPAMPDTEVVMSFHHLGDPIPLSRRVPLLENLGFSVVNERTYCVARTSGAPLYRHDMTLVRADGEAFDLARRRAAARRRPRRLARQGGERRLQRAGADSPRLPWRRAALLRTIARYLRQTEHPLFARLSVGRAAPLSRHRRAARRALRRALRAGIEAARARREPSRARRSRRRSRRSRASTTTRSCAPSARSSRRRSAPTSSRRPTTRSRRRSP